MTINIAKDYSETVGARYISGGPHSGEDFRDNFLESRYLYCLFNQELLVINFDGGYGYPPGFLEEVFGGMVRKGYSYYELISVMEFISDEEPRLISQIMQYMQEQEERQIAR